MPFAMAQSASDLSIVRENAVACQTYTWAVDGMTYTTDTVVTYLNATSDTLFVLNLTINTPFSHTDYANVNRCSYTWRGNTYVNSGNYNDTIFADITSGNCDSVYTLHLFVSNQETDTLRVSTCGEYTWNDSTYTVSGIYTDSTFVHFSNRKEQ